MCRCPSTPCCFVCVVIAQMVLNHKFASQTPHCLGHLSRVVTCAPSPLLPMAAQRSGYSICQIPLSHSTAHRSTSQFHSQALQWTSLLMPWGQDLKTDSRFDSRHIEPQPSEVMDTWEHGTQRESPSLLPALSWHDATEFKSYKESERLWSSPETDYPLTEKLSSTSCWET